MKIDSALLRSLAATHGDAFYILDSDIFLNNYDEMLASFRHIYPDIAIAYSYKTNYIPDLCRAINARGGCAEVVSEMEYELAERLGVPPSNIYCNGPYKKIPFLNKALLAGANVNLDSLAEVHAVLALAQQYPDRPLAVGLRCNFNIKMGKISRFGIDVTSAAFTEALSLLRSANNMTLAGLHCHFPFRSLESFRERAAGMTELTRNLDIDSLHYVSFGGGYFGKISPDVAAVLDVSPPTYADYAAVVAGAMRAMFPQKGPRLVIEPGSALVADAMCLAARVISVKTVRKRNIATLAASSYNINPSVSRGRRPISVFSAAPSSSEEAKCWDIVGYTCIEDDLLVGGYNGVLKEGDFVVFHNTGSYSLVFKPPFILPNVPVVDIARGECMIKRAETFDDIFATFCGI